MTRRPPSYFYTFAFCRIFAIKRIDVMDYPQYDNVRSLRAMELSSTLPDLSIASQEALRVVVAVDGETVFDEKLFPLGANVVLRALRDLVEPYAYERQTVTLTVTATTEGGTQKLSSQATVVYCEADFGEETAANYLSNHFLSILQGPKLTAMGRLELLPVQGNELATCVATYSDGTTASFSVPTYLAPTNGRQFTEFDASPSHFTTTGKTLTGYTITVGSRTQEYLIDLSAPDCAPILIFYNSFGVEEVVYCTGTHRVDPNYKRSTAYIGHYQRNYKIDETRAFKADTGPLTTAMANWLDDLFRSKCVRVANLYDGTVVPGKEVLITDSKSSYSNDDAEMPRFTFTYQYAQRNHNVVQLQRAGRIFDNTFDNTFN